MDRELTRQELQAILENMREAFGSVTADELDLAEEGKAPQIDDELRVDYELRDGRVCCILTRCVAADGKVYRLRVNSPLNGAPNPEELLNERERMQYNDELDHDPISGVYTCRYLEKNIVPNVEQWNAQGVPVALALISIDREGELLQKFGQRVMSELFCNVANEWKKYYYGTNDRVVCRITKSQFIIICSCMTGRRLAEEMRTLYNNMNCTCTIANGCRKQVDYTLTVACAGLDELENKNWQALYNLCSKRLDDAAEAGGDRVVCAENDTQKATAARRTRVHVQ
jgi:GGDEF domain-containing protein